MKLIKYNTYYTLQYYLSTKSVDKYVENTINNCIITFPLIHSINR